MSGIVAIIGRPNVGKSTLFNRLVESRKAIVDDASGVTRDRHYGTSIWNGVTFTVIDTGGYVPESEDIFEKAIREQVHIAMEEADLLLFMVDLHTGLMPLDREVANIVRQTDKPLILVTNKADHKFSEENSYEFYELGIGNPWLVSSVNGSGTGDLLDEVIRQLPKDKNEPAQMDIPRIAVVGRPNVGKSSFINALLGRDKNIVTPISGTTRDTINTHFTAFGHDVYLVDTAGLRKKAKVKENIEFYSTLRSIKAIEECDVAFLMIDATLGMEAQDLAILSVIQNQRKGLVILVNKWDLMEKETNTARDFAAMINERIAPLSNVPILFISALEKQRILKTLETALMVYENKEKKIPTAQLNEVMQASINAYKPPSHRGRFINIKYVTQIPASVPTFLFFANHPKHIKENYKRYLENQLREHFGFDGVPINVFFRQK